MAGSLLTSAGLSYFVCHTLEQYEARAIKLSIERKEAAAASAALTQRKAQGWLFNTGNFTARFEGRLHELVNG